MHIAQLNSIDIREGGLQIAKHIYLPDNLVMTLLLVRTAWLSSLVSLQEQEKLNSCDGPYLLVRGGCASMSQILYFLCSTKSKR